MATTWLGVRSAGATMAVIDRSLSMIYVNDEYARWFGTVPEELVGKTLVEVYGEQVRRSSMKGRVMGDEGLN